MMVSWLRSLLGLGSSLPLVETSPYVLGKAQPCPILLDSGTEINCCGCVTSSEMLCKPQSCGYVFVVIETAVLWREVQWKSVSY